MVDETEADGDLASAYLEVAASRGRVANILKVHSLSPPAMKTHLALYRQIMFGSSELSRSQRESIAVAVSTVNECHY